LFQAKVAKPGAKHMGAMSASLTAVPNTTRASGDSVGIISLAALNGECHLLQRTALYATLNPAASSTPGLNLSDNAH